MYARELEPLVRASAPPREPPHREPPSEDAALVAALIAGDQRAWRVFHERHAPAMLEVMTAVRHRFPHLIGVDDVRDIYAELCLQLLCNDKRRLRKFDPARGTSLRAWLGVLARHAAFDFLRLRRRQPALRWRGEEAAPLDAIADGSAPDPFQICCARERARVFAALVDELSARDRQFVELYFYEGLDPEQTAERLGICVGTVYSKKHKIRARIESLLGKRLAA